MIKCMTHSYVDSFVILTTPPPPHTNCTKGVTRKAKASYSYNNYTMKREKDTRSMQQEFEARSLPIEPLEFWS